MPPTIKDQIPTVILVFLIAAFIIIFTCKQHQYNDRLFDVHQCTQTLQQEFYAEHQEYVHTKYFWDTCYKSNGGAQ